MTKETDTDFDMLISELPRWNGGTGIDPESWISCMGNYELAVGYSLIFWPRFVRFGRYILRSGFSEEALRSVEQCGSDLPAIESLMNHIHIADIHCNVESGEAQLRYLGRILKDIHEVKLRRDFPDARFEVSFNDEADLNLIDYQLTFWQTAGR